MVSLTERHVQAVWYDAALRPKGLETRNGEAVHVISPGEWNLCGGPDFRQAVLEVGTARQRLVGDVEVHICPADWDFHHHGADPAYRNVIAHVTWHDGPAPATLPTDAVSIWLGRVARKNPAFDPEQIDLTAYPYARLPLSTRPCQKLFENNPSRSARVLDAAGRHRLRMKARRLSGLLAVPRRARRQVFYEEVMAALGYAHNAVQFRKIAERVPLESLPETESGACNALLVAASFVQFNMGSCRPNNHPQQRLETAARAFTAETSLLQLADMRDFSPDALKKAISFISHSTALGRGRAAAILTNVVIPLAMAENRLTDIPDWLPAEDISQPMRLTASRLFGRDHNPSAIYAHNGLYEQGLLQIRRDLCRRHYPECEACALVKSENAISSP